MNTFFNSFEMNETDKPASEAENDSLELEVPNHQEDTSQGGEFLDDVIWEIDQSLITGSSKDFYSDGKQ